MVSKGLEGSEKEAELASLMRLAQAGDKIAYRNLLGKVQALLISYIKNSLSKTPYDHSSAEDDIVQDSLLAIHSKRATYDPTQFFLPWMYAIARYKMIDYIRKHKSRLLTLSLDELESLEKFYKFESDPTVVADIAKLLSRLPKKQSEIIKFVKLHGLSMQEVAMKTGFSIADVKVSLHRGMIFLQESVKSKSGGSDEKN